MKTTRGKAVALWFIAAAVLTGISFCLDDTVLAFMKTHRTQAVLAFGRFGSHYGQWNWLMVPCILAGAVAWLRRDEAWLRILCVMVIASILAGLGDNVVRATTGRTRPSAPQTIEQGWYGPKANGQWVVINSNYNAFPSAHAAASMGLIAPLLLLRRRAGWLLLPLPILISAARICVNAHRLSDVVAGMLLGIGVAAWVNWKIAPRIFKWDVFGKQPA